jgi:hypothetical protein
MFLEDPDEFIAIKAEVRVIVRGIEADNRVKTVV